MEYEVFERDFIKRTLKIIDQYEQYVKWKKVPEGEQFEVTLLINCFLGLLVLPKDTYLYEKLPEKTKTIKQLNGWGLKVEHIEEPGNEPETHEIECPECKQETKHIIFGSGPRRNRDELTLKEVVENMRHSIAHFKIKPLVGGGKITHVEFSNKSGFKAKIPVHNVEIFAKKLAESVIDTIEKENSKKSRNRAVIASEAKQSHIF